MAGKDDLLLSTLDGGSELGGVGLLELLASLVLSVWVNQLLGMAHQTYDVGQLGLSNQVLSLGTDELLLKSHQSGALRLLHLGPCDLILDLRSVVSAWLNALLGVTNGLQHGSGLVQVVRIKVLLLANLTKQNTDLVGEVRDSLITSLLAPFGKLGCDGDTLLASSFIGTDQVVLGLDKLEETSGQVWLGSTAKTGEGEATADLVRVLPPLVGANGERSIPKGQGISIFAKICMACQRNVSQKRRSDNILGPML